MTNVSPALENARIPPEQRKRLDAFIASSPQKRLHHFKQNKKRCCSPLWANKLELLLKISDWKQFPATKLEAEFYEHSEFKIIDPSQVTNGKCLSCRGAFWATVFRAIA